MTLLVLTALVALAAGLALGRIRSGPRSSRRDRNSRLAAESFPNGVLLLFDRRLRHSFAAGRGLRAIGLSARESEGTTVRELFPDETWTVLEPAYRAALEGSESAFELPHGERDHLHRVVPVRDRAGAIVGGMLVAQDITDRKTREHRLKQWASRDGLTGLWNRDRLVQELDRALVEGRRSDDRSASLLFVDLDGFKAINDALGHAAGDDLLRAIGRELEGRVRFTDTVARVGGDEFAVLLPGATAEQAERVAEKITAAVRPSGRGAASGARASGSRSSSRVSDLPPTSSPPPIARCTRSSAPAVSGARPKPRAWPVPPPSARSTGAGRRRPPPRGRPRRAPHGPVNPRGRLLEPEPVGRRERAGHGALDLAEPANGAGQLDPAPPRQGRPQRGRRLASSHAAARKRA